MRDWFIAAVVIGIAVYLGCALAQDTDQEKAAKDLEYARANLEHTVDELTAGTPSGRIEPLPRPSSQPWPIRHPGWTALAAVIGTLTVGRVLVFMHRLESRT